jgi:hypothetical protein
MQDKRWLDNTAELNSNNIRSILISYFNDNKISSKLTQLELDRVCCLFTTKLLNTPDCVNTKIRILSYRDIFEILLKIFKLLRSDEDDLIAECYQVTEFFYQKNQIN